MSTIKHYKKGPLLYEQAQEKILDLIDQRNYIAGHRIPSERDLSERFGIHRMTVRKAIDRLIQKGVLERRGTSGTYIPAPVVLRPISGNSLSYSISQIVKDCGGQPGSKLLLFQQEKATFRAASNLKIKTGAPLIMIKRLRIIDNLPFCIETIWLPSDRVPGLVADDLISDLSFFSFLKEQYEIDIGKAKATLSASSIPANDAKLLGMKQGESALVIHAVTSDIHGVPIEYLTSSNHPRRVIFTIGTSEVPSVEVEALG